MLPEKYREKYFEFVEAWEKAEEVLKKVERIKNEVFIPSINELRYAGRRIVQAHSEYKNMLQNVDDVMGDCQSDHIDTHLTEAIENCRKARHDAIDSAINFVHERLDKIVGAFGLTLVLQAFPEYRDLRILIQDMDRKIVESRGGRVKMDGNYEEMKQNHLDKLVEFSSLLENSGVIIAQIAFEKKKDFFKVAIVAGSIVGILTSLLLVFLDKNQMLNFMIMQ